MLVYLILLIIYIFTVKVIMEKHAKFNFILKFPFGKTLQIILNKVFTFSQSIGNLWFYFMFFFINNFTWFCLLHSHLYSNIKDDSILNIKYITYCNYLKVKLLLLISSRGWGGVCICTHTMQRYCFILLYVPHTFLLKKKFFLY